MAARNFSDLWGSRGVFATNPFMEMQRDLNRLFGDTFRRPAPRLDVRESDDEVCVVADVPGVAPADLDLRIDGHTLTLSAERQSETEREDQNYHLMERSRGVMRRSVQLPFAPDPDQVHASYENGVLTVRMPKTSQVQRGRRIDVQSGAAPKTASGTVGAGTASPPYSGSAGTASSQSPGAAGSQYPGAAAQSASGSSATASSGSAERGPEGQWPGSTRDEGPGTHAAGSV